MSDVEPPAKCPRNDEASSIIEQMQKEEDARIASKQASVSDTYKVWTYKNFKKQQILGKGKTSGEKKHKSSKKKNKKDKKKKKKLFMVPSLGKKQNREVDPSLVLKYEDEGPNKVEIEETVRFAGKEMKIKKLVTEEEIAHKQKMEQRRQPKDELGAVLQTIKGTKAISTVTKTSMDWDHYKKEQGIEEELDEAIKDGYLKKMDFLSRVEGRKFEAEKELRARERMRRDREASQQR
eukprot:TRINITY_DN487_c1_g1_i1.p1 TRINITY_DN487_c1_g1~~TRINITY_DN487_c1_g1_i1.p1  ORF type:complete len:236 (+),score=72.53 TRINITY_DN487_c1_g1_i1:130-837(+)